MQGSDDAAGQRTASLRGIAFFVVAMFLFAIMDGISKSLTATYSPIQVLWIRYMIFAGFVLALAAPAGIARQARSRRPVLQVARAAMLVFESGIII